MVIAILIVIPEYWCDYSCLQRCLLAVWSMWYLATSRWPRICFSLPLTFFFCIFSLILVPPPPPSATNRNFHTSNKNANWQLHKLCLGPHIPQPVLVLTNQKKSSEGRSQSIQSRHMVRLFSHRNITAAAIKCTSIRAILHFYPETFFVQHFYTFL